MKTLAIAPAFAMAACVLAAATTTAAAAQHPTAAHGTPPGYQIVESSGFTAHSGVQSSGSVFCPAGTVVWGGGALIFGSSPNINLNSSFPMTNGSGWTADVNNVSGSDGEYQVQAVCAAALRRYQVVESPTFTVGQGSQATGSQQCPARTRLLGGGSLSNTTSLAVNINSEFPSFNAWHAAQNDNTNFDTTFNVLAICGKAPKTYTIATGPIVSAAPNTQSGTSVVCPIGHPLSGGVFTNTSSVAVDLNTSEEDQGGWTAFEDSGFVQGVTIQAVVICA